MRYWPIVFAIATGAFWGLYGPALAQSRTYLKSPFSPYVMIGVAYLVWGIGGGILGMLYKSDSFTTLTNLSGSMWGFIAGSLGAFGALALTLAMFSGGTAMPQIIMPIVFGTAVTVAAVTSAAQLREFSPNLIIGIGITFVGILIVAGNTPHPHPPDETANATTELIITGTSWIFQETACFLLCRPSWRMLELFLKDRGSAKVYSDN